MVLWCIRLLHGYDFVGFDVNQRRLLNEGRADHQPMMLRLSHELPTKACKRPLYHFDPCSLDKIIAWLDRATSRDNLLKRGDLLVGNGLWFEDADDTRDTRSLTNTKTVV